MTFISRISSTNLKSTRIIFMKLILIILVPSSLFLSVFPTRQETLCMRWVHDQFGIGEGN